MLRISRPFQSAPKIFPFQEHRPRSEDDRIGHERETPPRVRPTEVAASQPSSIDNTEKIENRHEYRSRHVQRLFGTQWFEFTI